MLTMKNNSNYIRKELTADLLRLYFSDHLQDEIDSIPVRKNPRDKNPFSCCIYRDRAMTRYRIMALLGISIEQNDDECKTLSAYLEDALSRDSIEAPVLTVLNTACSSCRRGAYRVTGECRGCLARPCQVNCPVDAVSFSGGKAVIDEEKCVNCGRCRDVCPFNAVIYTPVPCEESCPVGAVERDSFGRMFIDYDKCISCGKCTRSCPFGAVMERSQVIDTAKLLKNGVETTAMLAPSVIGQFPGSTGQLVNALKKAGFSHVIEVAAGAEKTAELEAAEFIERMEAGDSLMGTSCCPAYVETVRKHITEFMPFVSDTRTPMYYTAEMAEELYPGSKKVFIGPCTAKKYEAIIEQSADLVLTFEELGAFFMALDIDVNECEEELPDGDSAGFLARAFPAAGGVAQAVAGHLDGDPARDVNPLLVDGLTRKNLNLLKTAAAGKLKNNLVEVMACEGGCICGPGVISNPVITRKKLGSLQDESKAG